MKLKDVQFIPALCTFGLLFLGWKFFVAPSPKEDDAPKSTNSAKVVKAQPSSTDNEGAQYGVDLAPDLDLGDADSSADTIRRVVEYADAANDEAKRATENFETLQQETQKGFTDLENRLVGILKSKPDNSSEVSGLRNELENLKALIRGQNQPEPEEEEIVDESWVEIKPISGFNEFDSNSSFVDASGQSISPSSNDFLLNDGSAASEEEEVQTVFPVATIPANSPLLNSLTLSTLIGRVPRGGSVSDPYNFYVRTGADNLTSQGWDIPYLEEAIWRGRAIGDKDLHCVRTILTTVTFVFTDGSVQTIEEDPNAGVSADGLARGLGELVSENGTNCIPGKLVSNTREYLLQLGVAGALEGVGNGLNNTARFESITENGLAGVFSSSTGQSAAGAGLSTAASRASELIIEEYQDSFASVIVQSGLKVNIMATTQLNIDYDTQGRKVRYDYQ